MNCPRCFQEAIPATPQCPGCGFSLRALDAHFGSDPVVLERLIDAAHCLKLRERELLETHLLAFESRFPQLFASVYLGALPGWTTVSEFGFWLLNRSAIPSSISPRTNHHTFLLVLDPDSKTAAFTAGYAAEKILLPKALARSLGKARHSWCAGEFAEGISKCLFHLSKSLRTACRRIPGAHHAPAHQLHSLPPPDLSALPVPAPGSQRSDILATLSPSSPHPLSPSQTQPPEETTPSPQNHRLDLTSASHFINRPTASAV